MKRSSFKMLEFDHAEDKPYNKCIDCPNIGKRCDGPNFLAMSMERWCEWCKLRKEFLGWTNFELSEKSYISLVTIDRIMAGNSKDIRRSTMEAVTKALVNGSWGQYPCADDDGSSEENLQKGLQEKQEEIERLRRDLLELKADNKEAIHHTEEDSRKKVEYLKSLIEDLRQSVRFYRIALCALIVFVVGVLLVDITIGTVGWFRW